MDVKLKLPDIDLFSDLYKEDYVKPYLRANVTDFAALLGVDLLYEEKVGCYWLEFKNNPLMRVNWNGFPIETKWNSKSDGIRPIASYSLIKDYFLNEVVLSENVTESEMGLFPQSVVSSKLQKEIKAKIKQNKLCKTSLNVPVSNFCKVKKLDSYMYQGKIYTLCKANPFLSSYKASNGERYRIDDNVVIEYSPIKLVNFPKKDLTIFKNIITGGVYYEDINNYIYYHLTPSIIKSTKFNMIQENYKNTQKLMKEIQINLNKLQILVNDSYLIEPNKEERCKRLAK